MYGGNPADDNNPGVATGDFGVGDFGDGLEGDGALSNVMRDIAMTQQRTRDRMSARRDKARALQLDDLVLQQAKGPPMLDLMTPRAFDEDTDWANVTFDEISRRTPQLDLTQVDVNPWGDYTGSTFDHTNSIGDMQDMGYDKLGFLAGMIPGAKQITSLLNSINLHDLGPYMTEEEFNWDDDRWEGGPNSDFIRRLFTPQQDNPHTTDALEYGNAYDQWQGGDQLN